MYDVLVYAASVSELSEEALFQRVYRKLPQERQRKIDRLRMENDKRLSLGAFLLLLSCMKKWGIQTDNVSIKYGKEGKPYVEGAEGFYFNLSHSGEYAVCAVSEKEIGCDVEKLSECRLKLAKRFFSVYEYEMLLAQETEEEKRELFYRFWTLKESFIKAVGKGLYLPLDSFSILLSDVETTCFPLPEKTGAGEFFASGQDRNIRVKFMTDVLERKEYYFKEISVSPEYKCALCGLDKRIGERDGVVYGKVRLSDVVKELE